MRNIMICCDNVSEESGLPIVISKSPFSLMHHTSKDLLDNMAIIWHEGMEKPELLVDGRQFGSAKPKAPHWKLNPSAESKFSQHSLTSRARSLSLDADNNYELKKNEIFEDKSSRFYRWRSIKTDSSSILRDNCKDPMI